MDRMKKIAILLMVLMTLSAGFLSGCSEQDQNNEDITADQNNNQTSNDDNQKEETNDDNQKTFILNPTEDTWVDKNNPDDIHGNDELLYAYILADPMEGSKTGGFQRVYSKTTYFSFNLTTLPKTENVSKAEFGVYYTEKSTNQAKIYDATKSYPTIDEDTFHYGMYSSTGQSSSNGSTGSTTDEKIYLDVTNAFKYIPNFYTCRLNAFRTDEELIVYSKEYFDTSKHPYLKITLE